MNLTPLPRKADAKAWKPEADPDYRPLDDKPGTAATTQTIGGSDPEVDPKEIITVFNDRILNATESGTVNDSSGLSAPGGDAALLVLGSHELGHGNDENRQIQNDKENHADVHDRVIDTIKTSPDVERDVIRDTNR